MDHGDFTEIFECRKCGARYRAAYRIGLIIQRGHFDCEVCQAHVHKWESVRDYYEWERLQ